MPNLAKPSDAQLETMGLQMCMDCKNRDQYCGLIYLYIRATPMGPIPNGLTCPGKVPGWKPPKEEDDKAE